MFIGVEKITSPLNLHFTEPQIREGIEDNSMIFSYFTMNKYFVTPY